jgi:RNA polymerase sigma factor (sigma-70 family)
LKNKTFKDPYLKSIEDIEYVMTLIRTLNVASLNSIVKRDEVDDDTELQCLIMDDSPGPDELMIQTDTRERLLKFIDNLPPREGQVIKLRFGFIGGRAHTLEEIGQMYGVTRERIRQLECRGLKKLRWRIMVKNKCHKMENF